MTTTTRRVAMLTLAVGMAIGVGGCRSDSGNQSASPDFCAAVDDYAVASARVDASASVSDGASDAQIRAERDRVQREVREAAADLRAAVTDIVRRAPEDVDADIDLAMAADTRYLDVLEDNGYDVAGAFGDTRLEVNTEELAAATRVQEYTQLQCDTELHPRALLAPGAADAPAGPSDPSVPPVAPTGPTPPTEPRTAPTGPQDPPLDERPEPPAQPVEPDGPAS